MTVPLLLCELHAHSTWSDGTLTVRELVDMYGREGFGVLCITDHVTRAGDPTPAVTPGNWHAYVNELEREALRAERTYGLLLIPGAELTDNRAEPEASAHVLALGLRERVSVDEGIVGAIRDVRDLGCAVIAAHPYRPTDRTPNRRTLRLALEADMFRPLIHRWELFNRRETFGWVAEAGLPAVATGDVHRSDQIPSWKTALPCTADEQAVIEYLRSDARAYLLPYVGRAGVQRLERAA